MSKIASFKFVVGYKKDDIDRVVRRIERNIEVRERYWKEVEPSHAFWLPENKANAKSVHALVEARARSSLEWWKNQTPIEDKIVKYSSQGMSLHGATMVCPSDNRSAIVHKYEQKMVKYVS